MRIRDLKFIISSVILWRVVLFAILFIALKTITLQDNFLGGSKSMYLQNPLLWAWGNFDGEHYLFISKYGYNPHQYYFFPLYPYLVRLFAVLSRQGLDKYHLLGLVVSHIFFVAGLAGLWKLIKLDYNIKVAKISLLIILLFPVSFFFVSFYTESLFLALVVWALYFARKKMWVGACILGALASATRIIGLVLIPVFIIEFISQYSNAVCKPSYKRIVITFLAFISVSVGLIVYMIFLNHITGDFFAFSKSGYIYGEYFSDKPVFILQVFYRYIFKIVPNLNWNYFPVVFSTLLEFLVAILLALLSLVGLFRLRLSYWFFMVSGFIFPTLYVNFVSLPRYALVLFPMYILIADILSNKNVLVKVSAYTILFVGLIISLMLFSRGYRIA